MLTTKASELAVALWRLSSTSEPIQKGIQGMDLSKLHQLAMICTKLTGSQTAQKIRKG
jgi:hypothetical protein